MIKKTIKYTMPAINASMNSTNNTDNNHAPKLNDGEYSLNSETYLLNPKIVLIPFHIPRIICQNPLKNVLIISLANSKNSDITYSFSLFSSCVSFTSVC